MNHLYHTLSESFYIYAPIDPIAQQHAIEMADDRPDVTAEFIQKLYNEHINSEVRSLRASERVYIRRLIENFTNKEPSGFQLNE